MKPRATSWQMRIHTYSTFWRAMARGDLVHGGEDLGRFAVDDMELAVDGHANKVGH
jgi:hypothetical protein